MKVSYFLLFCSLSVGNLFAADFLDKFEKSKTDYWGDSKRELKDFRGYAVDIGAISTTAGGIVLVKKQKYKMWKEVLPKKTQILEKETKEHKVAKSSFETARSTYHNTNDSFIKARDGWTETRYRTVITMVSNGKGGMTPSTTQVPYYVPHPPQPIRAAELKPLLPGLEKDMGQKNVVMDKELKEKNLAIAEREKAKVTFLKKKILPSGSPVSSIRLKQIETKLKNFKLANGAFIALGSAAGIQFMVRTGLLWEGFKPGDLPLVEGVTYILEELNLSGADPKIEHEKALHQLFVNAYGENYYTDPDVTSNHELQKDLVLAEKFRNTRGSFVKKEN
jgi:hypothetical protein